MALGQQPDSQKKVRDLGTPVIEGEVTAYYSSGHERRAREILPIVIDAKRFYAKKLKLNVDFSVAVLDKNHWEKAAMGVPYGMPHVSAAPHVAFLPATSDGVVGMDLRKVESLMSKETIRELQSLGFTYEQAVDKTVDLIGLHELGHTYALLLGIKPGMPNRWFYEFYASYFAYAYLKEKQPKLARLFDVMTAGTSLAGPPPKYTTLEDFEKLYFGVGAANYSWYQGKFMELVVKIYGRGRLGFITRSATSLKRFERPAPINEVLAELEKVTPGFIAWSKDKRQPAAP